MFTTDRCYKGDNPWRAIKLRRKFSPLSEFVQDLFIVYTTLVHHVNQCTHTEPPPNPPDNRQELGCNLKATNPPYIVVCLLKIPSKHFVRRVTFTHHRAVPQRLSLCESQDRPFTQMLDLAPALFRLGATEKA